MMWQHSIIRINSINIEELYLFYFGGHLLE